MTLKIKNNLTNRELEFLNLDDLETSRLYYTFDITLSEVMEEGEYTYTLLDENEIIASGLLQIGDYVPKTEQYTAQTNNNGYITYNG